jgi:hypothetical protein
MTAESGSQLRLSLKLTLVVRLSPICEAQWCIATRFPSSAKKFPIELKVFQNHPFFICM